MSSRRCAWFVLVLALGGSACSDDERPPLRIGVVVDCVGINRSLQNAELSGAHLPLIERGARRRGGRPQDGITAATIAGRPVQLVRGCTEAFEFSMLNTELRRLAEMERVDAIVDRSRLRGYLGAYRKAFPGVRTSVARGELVTGYRDAMEALVLAFERAGGSTRRLPAELRRLRIGLLGGPVHLDEHGQAVITTSVVRVGATAPVRRIAGVDQSLGGLLAPTHSPGLRPAACERRRPPPWAR